MSNDTSNDTSNRATAIAAKPTLAQRYTSLSAPVRWMTMAAAGIFVMTVVQSLGKGEPTLLTSPNASGAMVRWAAPILLAGLGGLFAERAGVVNIGLEGMMILGTWFAAWGGINYGPWGAIAIGMLGGALGGLLHAIATVTFGVDHIISGVAINILAPGVARYLSDQVFRNYDGGSVSKSPGVDQFSKFDIPVIADALGWIDDQEWFFVSDVAGLLEGLVTQITIFTVLTYALVPISAWILWKTRFGLRVRICGENPAAGESLGVDILRYKFVAVIISGALAGLAGAFIVAELTGFYQQGQTTGRGFIGLAALIFGNWRAGGVLAGALVFGYPFGLSLQDLDGSATHNLLLVVGIVMLVLTAWFLSQKKPVDGTISAVLAIAVLTWYGITDTAPNWLPNAMPYAIVLVVLVFASQHLRPPAADGVPYRKGEH